MLDLTPPQTAGPDADLLSGNLVTAGMKPFAARYGGHQFGNWAGQLGDGRALSLGELPGVDGTNYEIQLKGAGTTPYSRGADGRAVLRSSIREFLCSEAMHHLGVPTTRALSLTLTGDTVIRDMFYSGNPLPEPGAIVARVAPSFVRFGSFEILTALQEEANLRALADFVIERYFPELNDSQPTKTAATYATWYQEICRRTGVLLAHWSAVGFVHGVMNTDNMSILGITIDYGPYGWLEPYELNWTPNTTDFGQHRYAYGRQPAIAQWNLMMLGQALLPLIQDKDQVNSGLDLYGETYVASYHATVLRKLGLVSPPDVDDAELIADLHQALASSGVDMTLFFRGLSNIVVANAEEKSGAAELFAELVSECSYPDDPEERSYGALLEWWQPYAERVQRNNIPIPQMVKTMKASSPKYVLRNYLAQQAIEAAEAGNLTVLHDLMTVLKRPYDEQPQFHHLSQKRPSWARTKPGCATLSCSS